MTCVQFTLHCYDRMLTIQSDEGGIGDQRVSQLIEDVWWDLLRNGGPAMEKWIRHNGMIPEGRNGSKFAI